MQKIVKILEKNVEWLALALGGAFLLWMIWLYAIQKPVTATVGGSLLTPGEVDAKTDDGPVRLLQAAMASQETPKMETKDFVSDLTSRLDPQGAAVAMGTPWSEEPLPASAVEAPPSAPALAVNPVTNLPDAPAPDSFQFSQGRSNVMLPPPLAPPGPGGAAPPAAGAGQPADKNWVTVAGIIHTAPIAAEFKKVNIPLPFYQTLILKVELVREEQQDNGTWGPEQVVPPLQNVSLMPLPAANANQQLQQIPYKDWAEKDQKDLLQPDFYQVLQADPWTMPGVPPPVAPQAPFDPSAVTDPSTLTPDQKKLYDDYQAQQAKDKADKIRQLQQQRQQQRQPAPGPGGPGGYGGGGYRGVANDPQRPITLAQATGAYPPALGGQPGPMPGQGGMPGMMPGGAPDAASANNINPAMNNPSTTLPGGSFDPTKQPDIVIWAHDDTAQPGKTYRYKLRYYLKNPVMQTQNVCKPQALANQFYITSTDSKTWTDAVNVKSETNFFAVNVTTSRNPTVKFDIFRWKNGAWQMQSADAGPGDMVGGVDPTTQTDFTTGLTLVTVIRDPNNLENQSVLLTTDGGLLVRHELTVDQNSPEHKKLKEDAQKALAAPKTTAAVP